MPIPNTDIKDPNPRGLILSDIITYSRIPQVKLDNFNYPNKIVNANPPAPTGNPARDEELRNTYDKIIKKLVLSLDPKEATGGLNLTTLEQIRSSLLSMMQSRGGSDGDRLQTTLYGAIALGENPLLNSDFTRKSLKEFYQAAIPALTLSGYSAKDTNTWYRAINMALDSKPPRDSRNTPQQHANFLLRMASRSDLSASP